MKITVFGAGLVGSHIALFLLMNNITNRVYLYDKNYQKALGESMDINQAMSVLKNENECITDHNIGIINNSDIVVIAVGRRRVKGEIRTDLYNDNLPEIIEISKLINEYCKHPTILMVTNPSDDLTKKCQEITKCRVISIGNDLDTARLRELVHQKIRKPRKDIECHVSGEHGEKMICHGVDEETASFGRQIAINTIIKKGATVFAPALSVVETIKGLE